MSPNNFSKKKKKWQLTEKQTNHLPLNWPKFETSLLCMTDVTVCYSFQTVYSEENGF